MNLKQYEQKHKFTTADMARNCGLPFNTYKRIRDHGSPNTAIVNIEKIIEYTGIDWKNFINKNIKHDDKKPK